MKVQSSTYELIKGLLDPELKTYEGLIFVRGLADLAASGKLRLSPMKRKGLNKGLRKLDKLVYSETGGTLPSLVLEEYEDDISILLESEFVDYEG